MSNDSTRKPRSRKAADRPKKPYPDFPLTPHASGAWQKKIRGKIHYFGKWGQASQRQAGPGRGRRLERGPGTLQGPGRRPARRPDPARQERWPDGCRPVQPVPHRQAAEAGCRANWAPGCSSEYKETTDLLVAAFGKDRLVDDLAADDFEKLRADLAERWGPVRLGNAITRVKSVFKYGTDNGLIERAPRFGSEFRKPDKAVLRRHRAQNGERMLEADELRQLLDAADVQLKAMILLGLNAGFGNNDVATLPLSALDLDAGWVNFPRPKTGIARRCPLWPETVDASASCYSRHGRSRRTRQTRTLCSSRRRVGAGCGSRRRVARITSASTSPT